MIREAEITDSGYIKLLLEQLGYPQNSEEQVKQSIQNYLNRPNNVYVYEEENKVIGFISISIIPMFHRNSGVGRITALCVNEKKRGNGIGTKLLNEAKRYCKSMDCEKIEVTSGNRIERKPTHKFYLNNGMGIDSTRFTEII